MNHRTLHARPRAAAALLPFVGLLSSLLPAQEDPRASLWRDDPAALAQSYLDEVELAPIELLLLGTFHFDDQGLDEYKPTHHFDPLADERRPQVRAVVDALVGFAPDLVCVERRPDGQARLDERYAAYRDGGLRDRKDEIAQIAYPLADRLGHERVVAVDAPGRWLEPRVDPMKWARENGTLRQLVTPLQAVGERFAADRDRFIDRADLRTILRFMNHPRLLRLSAGKYFVGTFQAGDGADYPGADGFVSQWYNRNLRIFANVRRVAKPGQRVVVLVGAGHVPILRHCAQASPEFRLVEVADVLPDAPR